MFESTEFYNTTRAYALSAQSEGALHAAQQLRQLGEVRRQSPRFVSCEQLGR
jgi:hypothetical protein